MDRLRVVELYCGIGGLATAMDDHICVASAVDIHRGALEVYRHNFSHPAQAKHVDSLDRRWLSGLDADLWWASPPCQPYTRRGLGRDLEDPRARTFLSLLDHLDAVRPRYVALENVVGFDGSEAQRRLHHALESAGYFHSVERQLCPSAFGVPNRRPRYYLIAGQTPLQDLAEPEHQPRRLAAYLDAEPASSLSVDPDVLERYRHAIHVVDADDPEAITHCFTSAYGRSPVRSGSYVRFKGRVRRFSPAEILRLLSFPASYTLPPDLDLRLAWRLVGNSLSLEPVRHLLSVVPELEKLQLKTLQVTDSEPQR